MSINIENIILKKIAKETLTIGEKELFKEWYVDVVNQKKYNSFLKINNSVRAVEFSKKANKERGWEKVRSVKNSNKVLFLNILKYAASILLPILIVVSVLYYGGNEKVEETLADVKIVPGQKQAVLTLSSGQQVLLTDEINKKIEGEKGTKISNTTDNVLTYENIEKPKSQVFNNLVVPRGGEYVLTLADGTKVWLNSDSELKYPTVFIKGEREVWLRGEAYFEVKKDAKKPFIVHSYDMRVRVLGTHFNVKSYKSDKSIATTLVEGSVQIEKMVQNKSIALGKIKPGQQAVYTEGNMEVHEMDVSQVVAWRYGEFVFKKRSLESIMDELARWYDINVFYMNDNVRDYHFSAWFKRDASINEVIKILEKTKKVKLDIKGKTVTIRENIRK